MQLGMAYLQSTNFYISKQIEFNEKFRRLDDKAILANMFVLPSSHSPNGSLRVHDIIYREFNNKSY